MAPGNNNDDDDKQLDNRLPTWDGCMTKFDDYKTRCLLLQDGTKEEELSMLAPRLARNLTDRAWEIVSELDRKELKKNTGVEYLMRELRKLRGKGEVDVLGDSFKAYFHDNDIKRKDKEELQDYLNRYRKIRKEVDIALKEIGSDGKIPEELYGWYLIKYMRLDASDAANVRGQAKSYKEGRIIATLQSLWSGGGLADKDEERKRRSTGGDSKRVLLAEDEESGTEQEEDGAPIDYNDMEEQFQEVKTWYNEAAQAFQDTPEDPLVAVNFRDARKALDQARTARGFYPVKIRQSGKQNVQVQNNKKEKTYNKNGNHGFKGKCLRCGKEGHRARDCRQTTNGQASGGSPPRATQVNGFCFMTMDEDEIEARHDEQEQNNNSEVHDEPNDNVIFASFRNECYGMAVLDCGASQNIIGLQTLEDTYDRLEEQGFDPEEEIYVDRDVRQTFRFGNDNTSEAIGVAHVTAGLLGRETRIMAHVVEGTVPLLLSQQFLDEMNVTMNFRTGQAIFGELSEKTVKLTRTSSGHWLFPIDAFLGNTSVLERMGLDTEAALEEVRRLSHEATGQTTTGAE
jgi:hypothetical protein